MTTYRFIKEVPGLTDLQQRITDYANLLPDYRMTLKELADIFYAHALSDIVKSVERLVQLGVLTVGDK